MAKSGINIPQWKVDEKAKDSRYKASQKILDKQGSDGELSPQKGRVRRKSVSKSNKNKKVSQKPIDSGVCRSSEDQAIDEFRPGQSDERTTRLRSEETLVDLKIRVPKSFKTAVVHVGAGRKISASSVANKYFNGDREIVEEVDALRERILAKDSNLTP